MRYIVIAFIFFTASCGSRRVSMLKTNSSFKHDSIAKTFIDSTVVENKSVFLNTETDDIEIRPLIDSVPMVVNGVTYKNVILRHKKTKEVLVDNSSKKESKKGLKSVHESKDESDTVKSKDVEREEGYAIYIVVVFMIILYGYIKNKILR